MSRNTRFYNQAGHSVIVKANDGSFNRPIRDFAEGDDAIAFEPIGDRVALSQGFDKSIISFSSANGGSVTIKLKPTSPDIGFLNKLFNRQRTTPTLLDVVVTTGVDDVIILRECGIMKGSSQTGGPTAQAREFVFIGAQQDFDESES